MKFNSLALLSVLSVVPLLQVGASPNLRGDRDLSVSVAVLKQQLEIIEAELAEKEKDATMESEEETPSDEETMSEDEIETEEELAEVMDEVDLSESTAVLGEKYKVIAYEIADKEKDRVDREDEEDLDALRAKLISIKEEFAKREKDAKMEGEEELAEVKDEVDLSKSTAVLKEQYKVMVDELYNKEKERVNMEEIDVLRAKMKSIKEETYRREEDAKMEGEAELAEVEAEMGDRINLGEEYLADLEEEKNSLSKIEGNDVILAEIQEVEEKLKREPNPSEEVIAEVEALEEKFVGLEQGYNMAEGDSQDYNMATSTGSQDTSPDTVSYDGDVIDESVPEGYSPEFGDYGPNGDEQAYLNPTDDETPMTPRNGEEQPVTNVEE